MARVGVMRSFFFLALSLLLSACEPVDCSRLGHVQSCSWTDAGTVACVDAGWQDAGWWHERNPDAFCVVPPPQR